MSTPDERETLDGLIAEWIALNPDLHGSNGNYIGDLSSMRYEERRGEAQHSTGHCLDVAIEFEKFVNARLREMKLGGDFDDDAGDYAWAERDAEYTWFGYQDRPEVGLEGDDSHSATLLKLGDSIFAVDWTASQYGYRGFPMVLEYVAPPGTSAEEILYERDPVWVRRRCEIGLDLS